jgi:hypothetical protein
MQALPHTPPVQVARSRSGTGGHGVQDEPQLPMSSVGTQTLPQRWNPVLQTKSQTSSTQVATPWAGAGHGVQLLPQLSGELSGSHPSPHT